MSATVADALERTYRDEAFRQLLVEWADVVQDVVGSRSGVGAVVFPLAEVFTDYRGMEVPEYLRAVSDQFGHGSETVTMDSTPPAGAVDLPTAEVKNFVVTANQYLESQTSVTEDEQRQIKYEMIDRYLQPEAEITMSREPLEQVENVENGDTSC